MFQLPKNTSIYICDRPVDFRKSFNGLCGEVTNYLEQNPLNGHLFVFYNKNKDKIKLLFWDNDGYWIFYKCLEKGTFEMPKQMDSKNSIELSHQELMLILSGIELSSIRQRKRYKLSA